MPDEERKPLWFIDCRRQGVVPGRSSDEGPVNQWAGPCRVFLDGVEVTSRCCRVERFADDGSGAVELYVADDSGQFLLNADKTDVVTERLFGKVEVLPMEKLEDEQWQR